MLLGWSAKEGRRSTGEAIAWSTCRRFGKFSSRVDRTVQRKIHLPRWYTARENATLRRRTCFWHPYGAKVADIAAQSIDFTGISHCAVREVCGRSDIIEIRPINVAAPFGMHYRFHRLISEHWCLSRSCEQYRPHIGGSYRLSEELVSVGSI